MGRAMRGMTLIELMIVLALLAILAAVSLPGLGAWKRKYDAENTIKELYALLNEARAKAFTEKRTCGVAWNGTSFAEVTIWCDSGASWEILNTVDLKLSVNETFVGNTCAFNERGLSTTWGEFFINEDADYNCIEVSRTRIKMGKRKGSECEPK